MSLSDASVLILTDFLGIKSVRQEASVEDSFKVWKASSHIFVHSYGVSFLVSSVKDNVIKE